METSEPETLSACIDNFAADRLFGSGRFDIFVCLHVVPILAATGSAWHNPASGAEKGRKPHGSIIV